MAKQKPIIEDLLALLPADQASVLRKTLDANPTLVVRSAKEAELYNIYEGLEDDEPATGAAASAVHVPAVPGAAAPAAAAAPATSGNDEIKTLLAGLQTSLNTKIDDLKKEFVPMSKVNEYVGTAVRVSDNYAQVREDHRAEFGETLNRSDFEKFISAQPRGTWLDDAPGVENAKTGMKKAHDAYVAARRTDKQIKEGVEAGVKQFKSQQTVTGQTQSVGLSPAAQVLAKAREGAGTGAKSNALAAAERLAAMVRAREEGSTAVQ